MKAFFTAKRRYHKPPLRGGQGALTRTPTLRRRGSVGLIASPVTSDELRWVSGDYGAEKRLHNTFSHVFSAPGNSPVKVGLRYNTRGAGSGAYGSDTGSIYHDRGLDEHSSPTQKSLKNQGKRPFRPKFSSPAARCKGLRLGDRATQLRIGHPGRHHHPRQPREWSRRPTDSENATQAKD